MSMDADPPRKPSREYLSEHTDKPISSFQKANELFGVFGIQVVEAFGQQTPMTICFCCMKPMTMDGQTMEHLISDPQYRADIGGGHMTKEKYNHTSNQLPAHSHCNTMKSTTDLFDFWMSDKCNMDPGVRERLRVVLQRIYQNSAKAKLVHFSWGHQRGIVEQIVREVLGTQ